MTRASWVELCVSDFEQSIMWFENVLGFRVTARDANEYVELSRDEAYLRICRETGRTSDLVNRLLTLGCTDEAVKETRRVDDLAFLGLVDPFIQHGQDAEAERLVKARIQEKPVLHFLEWPQKYYRDRGNPGDELEVTETLFRTQPSLQRYQDYVISPGGSSAGRYCDLSCSFF